MKKVVAVRNILGSLGDLSANWVDSFDFFAQSRGIPLEFVEWTLLEEEDWGEIDLLVTNLGSSDLAQQGAVRLIHETLEREIPVLVMSARPWLAEKYDFFDKIKVTGYASGGLSEVLRTICEMLKVEVGWNTPPAFGWPKAGLIYLLASFLPLLYS